MKHVILAIVFLLTLFSASSSAAADDYAVIIGTYSSKANADRQLRALETHFGSKPEMVQLQEANGFDYMAIESAGYYVVAIKPIAGKEALDSVYLEARNLFPGLYVSHANNFIAVDYHASEPAALPEAEPVEQPAQTVVKEAPADEIPADDIPAAMVEPEEPVEKEPVEVKPTAPVVPVTSKAATPAWWESMLSDDMTLYGGAGLVAVLLVLFLLLRRKKPATEEAAPAPLEELVVSEPEMEAIPEVQPEAPSEAAEPEIEVETPEEVIELEPSEEAGAVEEAVPEAAEEAAERVPEEVPEAKKGTPRQKRFYQRGMEPITKESFSLFAGVRILVAEDNLINQKVIAGLLADTGIELVMANDGKEALNTLESDQDFQMVLMDAHMPIMDGFEATDAIRKNPLFDAIPVIALSGDTGADDIRNMMEAGMEGHLEKPLHMDALYEILYNFCDIEVEEEPEEEIELLPDTPELHAEKGLDISMGDEALYKEILSEFSTMYGDSDEVLHDFMVKDQASDANALLLDVHGIAANIGADRLAATADQLREALMNRDEKRYGELYNEYVTHLKAVLNDIKKI